MSECFLYFARFTYLCQYYNILCKPLIPQAGVDREIKIIKKIINNN